MGAMYIKEKGGEGGKERETKGIPYRDVLSHEEVTV